MRISWFHQGKLNRSLPAGSLRTNLPSSVSIRRVSDLNNAVTVQSRSWSLVLPYGSSCVVRGWLVGADPARRWGR
jgi:hypothetical protein